ILANGTGKRLVLTNCTINGPLVNQGMLSSHQTTDVTGTFTAASGSLLSVDGVNGTSQMTFTNGFTNNGTIELTSTLSGYVAVLNVTNGTLVNEVGKSINVLAGAGGTRSLGAQLDNRGTVTVGAPFTLNKTSGDHLNSGTFDLSTQDMTLTQNGTTPSFTTTGTITIGAGHTLSVNG